MAESIASISEEHQGVRAHGEEVPEDGGPLPLAPGRRIAGSRLLEPYEATIDAWLPERLPQLEERAAAHVRVFVRLRDEKGYGGSYSTVQRYVKRRREDGGGGRQGRAGYLQLSWLPGGARSTSGGGLQVRRRDEGEYLGQLPTPTSGSPRCSGVRTSECVPRLRNACCEFVGGVPAQVIFDNATEVGRRVCGEVQAERDVQEFSAHYTSTTFRNPYSGILGKTRRGRGGRLPPQEPVRAGAADTRCPGRRSAKAAAGLPRHERGEEALQARRARARALRGGQGVLLRSCRRRGYQCVRWGQHRCSKQGVFTLGSIHRCLRAGLRGQERSRLPSAHSTRPRGGRGTGEVVADYEREWGSVRRTAPTRSCS